MYEVVACTICEIGETAKEVVVAGVVMVTIRPLLVYMTLPDGPAVSRVKEVVGSRDGGLLMPPKVNDIVPAANPEGKQLFMSTIDELTPTTQLTVAKEAAVKVTVPKVIVVGNPTLMLPPLGIGSSITAANTYYVAA